MRLRFASALASVAALVLPARALAYDVLAAPCVNGPLTCGSGAVTFNKVDALPIHWSLDGGFALDVAVELDATYVTERVVVNTTDGKEVAGGSFTTQDGQSSTSYTNGPNIELDIHPEGTVNYDGVVHLIPTFYITLLGN